MYVRIEICLSGFLSDPSRWVQPLTRRLVPLVGTRLASYAQSRDLGLFLSGFFQELDGLLVLLCMPMIEVSVLTSYGHWTHVKLVRFDESIARTTTNKYAPCQRVLVAFRKGDSSGRSSGEA